EKGFTVLTYTSDDVVLAQRLEKLGVHAVMPGASPIGSGQGIINPLNLSLIIEQSKIPVIVDAGIGSPKDALQAMELGAEDRKSTRLNSSHVSISYAVFC